MKASLLPVFAALVLIAGSARAQTAPASFGYVLQADALAKSKSAAIQKLSSSGRDWVVLDATFSDDTPWTSADLATIRRGKPGRKVIAYLSIGEAEDYRPYWHKEWTKKGKLTSAAPEWLGPENPDWKGNYRVKYWLPAWQSIILSALDGIMANGFDGVYLDIVDGFESYEQDGKNYIDDRQNPETRQSYRRDMVDWVKIIAARARTANASALVIPQNASQLVAQADYLSVISAVGIEDLFTDDNQLQPKSETAFILDNLKPMKTAKKPMFLIEYPKSSSRIALVKQQGHANGFVWLVTDRELTTLGTSGN